MIPSSMQSHRENTKTPPSSVAVTSVGSDHGPLLRNNKKKKKSLNKPMNIDDDNDNYDTVHHHHHHHYHHQRRRINDDDDDDDDINNSSINSGGGGGNRKSSGGKRGWRIGLCALLCLMLLLLAAIAVYLSSIWWTRFRVLMAPSEQTVLLREDGGSGGDAVIPGSSSINLVKSFFNRLDSEQQRQYKRGFDEFVQLLELRVSAFGGNVGGNGNTLLLDRYASHDALVEFLVYMNDLMDTKVKIICGECPEERRPTDKCHYERFSFLTRITDHIFIDRTDLQIRFPKARNLHKCAFMHDLFLKGGWKRYEQFFTASNYILSKHKSDAPVTLDSFRTRYFDKYCKWGVNVIGSIRGEFGIGETSRSTVKALLEPSDKFSRVPLSITDLGDMDNHRTTDDLIERKFGMEISNSNEYVVSIVHAGFHEMLHQKKTMKNNDDVVSKYKIGMWNWELERFPAEWILDTFNQYDEIWAPSLFNLDVFAEAALQPIVKMPYIVDLSEIADQVQYDRAKFGIPENAYAFLITFDFLSYPERKNPDGALRAFVEAFPHAYIDMLKQEERQGKRKPWQRPFFVFKSTNVHAYAERFGDTEKYASMKRIAKDRDDVLFLDEHLSRHDSFSLKKSIDCFVSLHRSEGFGFNLAEAMYLDKPVIGTAYSSTLDFMNSFNSYLVDMNITSIKKGYGVYQTGYRWAEPDVGHAAKIIRHVFENQKEATETGHRGAETIRKMFNPHAVGERMKQRIEYIKKRILKMPVVDNNN